MRICRGSSTFWLAIVLTVFLTGTNPGFSFADDSKNGAEKKTTADGAAPALTEREQWLLERVQQLEKRVEELEGMQRTVSPTNESATATVAPGERSDSNTAPAVAVAPPAVNDAGNLAVQPGQTTNKAPITSAGSAAKTAKAEPFAFADFTWLNGNARTKDTPYATSFFTPEIRADVDYVYDFNHPKDDTIGGSSEVFRSNEVQVTQLGVGGDFHLRQCARAIDDAIWFVFADHAAERRQPCTRAMESGQRVPLSLRSVRRLSLQRAARHQRRCRNLHVVYRAVQLLPVRQLGLSAFLRFLQHAVVFQWRASADLPDRAFENRAVVYQWLAVLRTIQQPARIRLPDSVAAEWLVVGSR